MALARQTYNELLSRLLRPDGGLALRTREEELELVHVLITQGSAPRAYVGCEGILTANDSSACPLST